MVQLEDHEFTYSNGNAEKKTFYHAAGPKEGPLLIFIHGEYEYDIFDIVGERDMMLNVQSGWPGIGKTWEPQMRVFAEKGFRTVAPDMPGNARFRPKSLDHMRLTVCNKAMDDRLPVKSKRTIAWSKSISEWSRSSIISVGTKLFGLVSELRSGFVRSSLLGAEGWIGHDWGCGALWSFAEHLPERCFAAAGLAVPSHTIEMGLGELMKCVNRDIYPEKEHPWAQW